MILGFCFFHHHVQLYAILLVRVFEVCSLFVHVTLDSETYDAADRSRDVASVDICSVTLCGRMLH